MSTIPPNKQSITLRLENDLIDTIDDLRRIERDLPTRQEMIRRIVEDWLEMKGNQRLGR
jgi:metal-responsive CopG/Arc/MetJ family transcriptional regulator